MRYFLTINASHPYIAGGLTFSFEPVQNRGGSWLGVLSVDDESAASALAAAGLYGVPVSFFFSERKRSSLISATP